MKRKYKILLSILLFIVLFLGICNIIPPKKAVKENPFITDGLPMLCAHRGGAQTSPENTIKAYKNVVNEYQADILETDLWLTSDNEVVLNHDSTINRTSDVEEVTGSSEKYYISDHSLKELKQFNFGYKFEINGIRPYENLINETNKENREAIIQENELSIVTLDELFKCFYETNKEMLFIVEIKNSGEKGYKIADKIAELLNNKYPDYKNRIVVGTFNNEVEEYLKNNHPQILRGASPSAVIKFVATQVLKVNIFENQTIACLQLPLEEYGIPLTWDTYIKRAHRKNIAVQYWTINDAETMRMLIEKGVDAIMTDNPALLRQILNEYK